MALATTDDRRYLVTLAMVPDEGSWCTSPSYADLRLKVQALWCIADVAFVYHLHSANGRPIAVRIISEEDFTMWYQTTRLHSPKLTAHDLSRASHVQHSSGMCTVSPRIVIDSSLLRDCGAAYCVKHPAHDEVVLIGASESMAWANAVIRAQRSWLVKRPIFRYLDEGVAGERVVISILTPDDFATWVKRKMSVAPQLVVFEHARETGGGHHVDDGTDSEQQRVEEEAERSRQERAEKTIADAVAALTPPAIKNRMSIDEMKIHGIDATGMPHLTSDATAHKSGGSSTSASAHHLAYLTMKLARLQAIEKQ